VDLRNFTESADKHHRLPAILPQLWRLYGSDPSFVADYADAFIGRGAVKVAYTQVFKTIRLNGRFSVHEIVDMGGDLLSDW